MNTSPLPSFQRKDTPRIIDLLSFRVVNFYQIKHYMKIEGPCKVRNETETKRNETKQIETKRNKSKRNETNQNETKRNKTNRNET